MGVATVSTYLTAFATPCYALAMASTGQVTRATAESGDAKRRSFPWERRPDESIQAYRRFMQYRLMPPGERSLRKLEIAYTLASRWAKRYQWTKRTVAYDDHVSECIDGLSNQAQIGARYRAARLGSAFVRHVERNLDQVKLTGIEDAVNLAKAGVEIERQALAINSGDTKAERQPLAQVSVSFQSAWLGKQSEARPNELVLSGEQVLGETTGVLAQTVQVPPAQKLPTRQLETGTPRKRLTERLVPVPNSKGTQPPARPLTEGHGAKQGGK